MATSSTSNIHPTGFRWSRQSARYYRYRRASVAACCRRRRAHSHSYRWGLLSPAPVLWSRALWSRALLPRRSLLSLSLSVYCFLCRSRPPQRKRASLIGRDQQGVRARILPATSGTWRAVASGYVHANLRVAVQAVGSKLTTVHACVGECKTTWRRTVLRKMVIVWQWLAMHAAAVFAIKSTNSALAGG